MSLLHLITPGYRPDSIQKILTDLTYYKEYPFIWHLIMDNKISINIETFKNYDLIKNNLKLYSVLTNFNYGFEQRRYFCNEISSNYNSNDWGYFLDDDNLITPDIFTAFNLHSKDSNAKVVMLSQIRYGCPNLKRLYGRKGHTKVNFVDIGSFIFKLDVVKDISINVSNYAEDGNIVEQLYGLYPEAFRYEECLLTTYNILR